MGELAGLPLHDAQEELSSLQTPLSCGYPGELLGLEVWVRRPSQGLRIVFLYSQPLKSRARFPASIGLRTKVCCDLSLWGGGESSPGWFWAQQQQQELPGCQP